MAPIPRGGPVCGERGYAGVPGEDGADTPGRLPLSLCGEGGEGGEDTPPCPPWPPGEAWGGRGGVEEGLGEDTPRAPEPVLGFSPGGGPVRTPPTWEVGAAEGAERFGE